MRRELPFELVEEILTRVPVKDLIRFRCVCKTWRSLFEEERFYRQHMTHAPTRIVSFRRSDTLLGRFSYENGKPEMMILEDVNLNVRDNKLLLDAGLVGHCHGLFCLYFEDKTFGIWNPSLIELRRIQTMHVSNWAEMGFGYDHSSQDYKIVLVLNMRGSRHSKALVLSLTSGVSRMIDVPCLENIVVMIRMRLPGTLVGENIYWQVYDDKVKVTDKILSFDLVSETFNYCPGPSNCGKAFPKVLEGLRGGGLCTVGVDALSGDIIVWSAQHNEKVGGGAGSIKSWSKICSLSWGVLESSTSCLINKIRLDSAINYAGLLLILVNIGRESKLLAYNLEEKSLTNVETSLSLHTCGSLQTYVETLVPIPLRKL